MLSIDGSMGEGGGQVLRSSLALSLCLGRPFRMTRIRAARSRPGLQRQHLAAVRAAAAIGHARVAGDELHSQTLEFAPAGVAPGDYRFDIGSAGSTALVLQTVLPPLLTADGPSRLVIQGGTHNPMAPTFEFIRDAFLPLLVRMGPRLAIALHRPGFYPVGGGELVVSVDPVPVLAPLSLHARGELP
ncbi:MAG TPA: RNA 3'-phosphate cyclase [Thioalkalivibrio sp.]|nr:RNA 3'-phosphate cyclase [Thioalkalivibrio sp.]